MPQGIYDRMSVKDRFEKYVFYGCPSGCHWWIGAQHIKGYGYFGIDYKTYRINRVSYELYKGDIPKGLQVCHTCDNRLCVNPDHLFLGTSKDNVNDMMKKGRHKPNYGEKNGRAKLSNKQVDEIKTIYSLGGVKQSELASKFGVSRCLIGFIINGSLRSKQYGN